MTETAAPSLAHERAESVWALPRDRSEGLHLVVIFLADGWQACGKVVSADGVLYPVGPQYRPACGHVPADSWVGENWSVLDHCRVCEMTERGLTPLRATLVPTARRGLPGQGQCYGTNHRHGFELGDCGACGKVVARKGDGLVEVIRQSTERGERFRPVCWSRHECDPYDRAWRTVEHADQVADGALVRGQTVEVVRGRKVAKGTVGVIRWIGEDSFKPGTMRLGLAVEGVERLVYTSESNVEARPA